MRLLLATSIPLHTDASGQRHALDLWVQDVSANAKHVQAITVLAPRAASLMPAAKPWPSNIAVAHHDDVPTPAKLANLVQAHDLVSVGAGRPAWRMRNELRVARAAQQGHKALVTSVSSNRALTTVMNASDRGLVSRLKAQLEARSILATTRRMAALSDAVMVVGHGVAKAMGLEHAQMMVETASWIQAHHVLDAAAFEQRCTHTLQQTTVRAAFAGRLESMKGPHIAIEALAQLRGRKAQGVEGLSLFGQGPEDAALRALAASLGLQAQVRFEGVRSYPEAFLQALRSFDLVLMTNLNDEQPRLVFDAISQGVIPLCPDTPTYRALGLPESVFFPRGDASALARVWSRFGEAQLRMQAMQALRPLAFEFTIDTMHRKRAAWMHDLVERKAAQTR